MAERWIGHRRYRSKKAAEEAVQAVRDRYPIGETVSQPEDQALLRDLAEMHPDAGVKIGAGIAEFVIEKALYGSQSAGFKIVRVDGTEIDFSFHKCLKPPSERDLVLNAMRAEVKPTVSAYFQQRLADGTMRSDLSGVLLPPHAAHVSYFQGPAFVDIATEFVESAGGWSANQLTTAADPGTRVFADRDLARRWRDHHDQHAVLGLLTPQENLRRPRGT